MATTITTSKFGAYRDGRDVTLYTLKNANGTEASVTNIGAILVKLLVADKEGTKRDVVLGFDRAEDYLGNGSFFGAVIGPSANRIGKATFSIDGVTYQVAVNDGENNLHSDAELGYHKCLWDAEIVENGVKFSLEDPDGSMGFPGNKKISVEYLLDDEDRLTLHYHGSSDKNTLLNLTNHTYFNLNGQGGKIEDHELWLGASTFTPAAAGSIPTGEIAPVSGTPMDFTTRTRVGDRIDDDYDQLKMAGGYDHNWVIDGWKNDGTLIHFATVVSKESGIQMDAYTDLPGVQFYAGNFIGVETGKNGTLYGPRMGLCLETQYYPNSINRPMFPACVFGGDKEYDFTTIYQFKK